MTAKMAMAQRATKLTMMAMMMTLAMGGDDYGATGDSAAGYEDDDDGDG